MLSRLVKIQEEAVKSQNATAKSLENRIVENTRSQEVSARAALANLWHACPKWHARRFCVARAVLLR